MTSLRSTGRANRRCALLVVAAGVATVAACSSPREEATTQAAERVRASAYSTRDMVRDLVSTSTAPRGQALLDDLLARLPAGADVITFDKRVREDGAVSLRTAFHARAETGGGLSHESVVARLCVEFIAAPGPPPTADVRDTECAPTLPQATGNAGNVDITVPLRG